MADSIRLVWSATNGAGTIGSSNITAATGDSLSLDVILDSSLGAGMAAVSLNFASSPLSLQSVVPSTTLDPDFSMAAVEANAGTPVLYDGTGDGVVGLPDLAGLRANFFGTSSAYDFNSDGVVNFIDLALFRTNFGAGSPVTPSATRSLYISIGDFDLATLAPSQLLATLNFDVTGVGSGNINPGFNPGIDGVFDAGLQDLTSTITLSGATVTVVPLPAAVWMFGSALLCLVGLKRRRRLRA